MLKSWGRKKMKRFEEILMEKWIGCNNSDMCIVW